MDLRIRTEKIKKQAYRFGFDAVGVARAEPLPGEKLNDWLQRRLHGQMAYLERNHEKRLNPRAVLPGARSILCVALNYYFPYQLPYQDALCGVVSRYASGDDYHEIVEDRLRSLLDYIQQIAPGTKGKCYVDTGPVLEKPWATRAGLGWIGKHTNLIAKRRLGSWFFLGEILIDLELEYDQPALDHCGSCTQCIQACPTEAIVAPYVLDSRRCISYLTIELREDIPEEFRTPLENLIFGCDICQDVCPWNRKATPSSARGFKPREGNRNPTLSELARLSEEQFRSRFAHSPIRRAKWQGLMRNVAVAIGNSKDPNLISELKALLSCSHPMVRRHAAWALAQIGGPEARSVLRSRCDTEQDEETRKVLRTLLRPASRKSPSSP